MAIKFRKSIKVAPGINVNINKNSVSVSGGVRGARKTISSTGRTTTTVGVPGTGLYSTNSKRTGGGTTSDYEEYESYGSTEKTSFFDQWEDNPRDCNKLVYILLAFFLGMFGVHKFYQGKTKTGMKCLVFFWTGVPWFWAILEGLFFTCQILFGLAMIGIKKITKRGASDVDNIENL